jgi:hypothetical protein
MPKKRKYLLIVAGSFTLKARRLGRKKFAAAIEK